MIVVKVELMSAITGKTTELARMTICNEGTSNNPNFGDYTCKTHRGRDREILEKSMRDGSSTRAGTVKHHARLAQHVWNLVAKALKNMNYGEG